MNFPRLCHACESGSAARAHGAHDSHPEELGSVIMAGKFYMEVYSYGHLLIIAGFKGLCMHSIFLGL